MKRQLNLNSMIEIFDGSEVQERSVVCGELLHQWRMMKEKCQSVSLDVTPFVEFEIEYALELQEEMRCRKSFRLKGRMLEKSLQYIDHKSFEDAG